MNTMVHGRKRSRRLFGAPDPRASGVIEAPLYVSQPLRREPPITTHDVLDTEHVATLLSFCFSRVARLLTRCALTVKKKKPPRMQENRSVLIGYGYRSSKCLR
jgi:hypothetical protein